MTRVFALLAALVSPAAAFSSEQAAHLAGLALTCATAEFPNKPDHVANGADDLARPRAAHPAFYGCYDWHSSVHGHWLMVRALRGNPGLPRAS